MKKTITLISALTLAFVLVGCAQQISGTPSQVIEACQPLPNDTNAEVTVTGYQPLYSDIYITDDGDAIVTLSDSYDSAAETVRCFFRNPSEDLIDTLGYSYRVTIRGKLDMIMDSSVVLDDCILVG